MQSLAEQSIGPHAKTRVLHPRAVAAVTPDKPALFMVETGQMRTYRQLVDRADRAARLFASLGLEVGDTVAFHLSNQIEYAELCWAAKNAGLHYVAIPAHHHVADLAYILADSDARLIVTTAEFLPVARAALQCLPGLVHRLSIGPTDGDFQCYETCLLAQPATPLDRPRGASMLYSSGTTGRPKAVRFALNGASPNEPSARHDTIVRQFGLGPDVAFLNPGPFYHAAPQRFMMMVQREGGTVLGFERFDAMRLLNAIQTYRATHGFMVPTMFGRLLRLPGPVRAAADLSSLRCVIHGASPCLVDIKRQMIEWWGPILAELYSGTEAVGHTFISSREWLLNPGSVGRPPPECEIKIVDDTGAALPPAVPGRIMFRNGKRFRYHKDPEKTRAAYDTQGYASLGHIGYLNERGYLFLTDRESHMIVSGGVNIYPQEAEAVLATHPAVEDVAIIGVPDADLGEAAKAIVQPVGEPVDEAVLAVALLAFCRARLSAIKCPKSVDFIERLPRTELGKLAKHKLKAPYWVGTGRQI